MIVSFLKSLSILLVIINSDFSEITMLPDRSSNEVSFSIEGKYWQSDSNIENAYGTSVSAYVLVSDDNISIYAENKKSPACNKIIIQLTNVDSNVEQPQRVTGKIKIKSGDNWYSIDRKDPFEIVLSSFDKEKRVVEGTFHFSAISLAAKKLKIEVGDFKLHY